MTKSDTIFLRKFRRRLNRVIDQHCGACGFEEEMAKGAAFELELERWVLKEFQACYLRGYSNGQAYPSEGFP